MTTHPHTNGSAEVTKPPDQLVDEAGSTNHWLVAAWSMEDIRREWDWLFDPGESGDLPVVYYRFRATTAEELADEDFIYDTFGDVELGGVSTDTVCVRCKKDHLKAHAYWTTEP